MWRREPEETPDDSLLEWFEEPTDAESRIMVVGISGFLDAGGAVKIAVDHILENTNTRVLAGLDIDLLYDYRARRPRMSYMSDHFEDIELPEIQLVECTDELGNQFLLLHGVEPDTGWMTVVDTLVEVVEDLDVSLVITMQAVPFPAPHTRPVAITAHATDTSLIAGRLPWVGNMEVPGSLAGFFELQLGRDGHKAMGFVAHVPQYLANMPHPRSALTLIGEVCGASGLDISTDQLRAFSDKADAELNEQIAENDENRSVVQGLEESFDQLVAQRGGINEGAAPSGDEIAAQVEKFLAEMDARGRENE
jgi:proteasome assembly chaperone (PAC2) family protein